MLLGERLLMVYVYLGGMLIRESKLAGSFHVLAGFYSKLKKRLLTDSFLATNNKTL